MIKDVNIWNVKIVKLTSVGFACQWKMENGLVEVHMIIVGKFHNLKSFDSGYQILSILII